MTIPGRGFDYQFSRTYRSQNDHRRSVATNDFGVDWAFSYSDDRLIPDGNNVIVFRDLLRTDPFVATATPGVFSPPMGYYEQLRINAQGDFELRNEDGMVKTYQGFSDPFTSIPGRLLSMEDRNGNVMRFIYGVPEGSFRAVLTTVVETMGRNIVYRYYSETESNVGRRGRLKEIEDFRRDNFLTGRKLQFDYDEEGNLISVTSPIVQGTPTGNDFPVGKTTRYTYTREADVPPTIMGVDRQRLLHNLVAIEYPNEAAVTLDPSNPQTLPTAPGTKREVLTYYTDATDSDQFDGVRTYAIGGTNGNGVQAGGTITYRYEIFMADHLINTTVTDRRGNVTKYVHSRFDMMLEKREFTRGFRNREPEAFVMQAEYNLDKLRVQEFLPEGNTINNTFDEENPDRFQQGNLIRMVRTPDPARGGDQTALFTETVYEPIYQQPAAVTDSPGAGSELRPSYL